MLTRVSVNNFSCVKHVFNTRLETKLFASSKGLIIERLADRVCRHVFCNLTLSSIAKCYFQQKIVPLNYVSHI